LKDLELIFLLEINCLYFNEWIVLFFYVNYIMIISLKKNTNDIQIFEKTLMQRFEMRILDELKWFLKLRITRDQINQKIWLCQNSYVIKMTAKFNLKAMKSLKTLLIALSILTKTMNAKKSNSQLMYAYQQRVESLNFAAIISRFDIVFVIFKLIQYL
jgi:hypothetical protein